MLGSTSMLPNIVSYKKLQANFHKFLPKQSIYALYPDSWWQDTIEVKTSLRYNLGFAKEEVYTVEWNVEASFNISDGELCEIKYYTPTYDTMECRKYYERILEYIVAESKEKLIKLPDDVMNYCFRDSLRYYGLNKLYSVTANMIVNNNERDLFRIIIYHRRLNRDDAHIELHKYPRRLLPEAISHKIDSLTKPTKQKYYTR